MRPAVAPWLALLLLACGPAASVVAPDLAAPSGPCADDSACPRNQVCDATRGACVRCLPDRGCDPGYSCSPLTTTCVPSGSADLLAADAALDLGAPDAAVSLDGAIDAARTVDLAQPLCDCGCGCIEPPCYSDTDCANLGSLRKCDPVSLHCVGCVIDGDCAPGYLCSASQICLPGCSPQHPCAPGRDCCGGLCMDLTQDPTNCGACGNDCAMLAPAPVCDGNGVRVAGAPYTCGPSGCGQTTMRIPCAQGCSQADCLHIPDPSLYTLVNVAGASATSGAAVYPPDVGSADANQGVDFTVEAAPQGSVQAAHLYYALGANFPNAGTDVAMTASGAAGSNERWKGSVPAQPAGTTVWWYLRVDRWDGAKQYWSNFGNNFHYTTR